MFSRNHLKFGFEILNLSILTYGVVNESCESIIIKPPFIEKQFKHYKLVIWTVKLEGVKKMNPPLFLDLAKEIFKFFISKYKFDFYDSI